MKWLLFLLILSTQQTLGLDITTKGLYRSTKEACSRVTKFDLHNLNADKLRAGYFPSREFNEINNFIRSESAKSAALEMNISSQLSLTNYILADLGFHQALKECYPNTPELEKFFVDSIRRSDRAGKIVGVTLMLITFKGAGKLLTLIKDWSQAAFRLLQLGGKAAEALMLASLLNADSTITDIPLHLHINSQDINNESDKISEMENSIRTQIKEQEEKLKSCSNCPEKDQLQKNKAALQQILESAK